MITPDSQSLARLPCPIHDDDSGWRRGSRGGGATGLVAGQEAGAVLVVAARALAAHMTHRCGVRRSELTITELIGKCHLIGNQVLSARLDTVNSMQCKGSGIHVEYGIAAPVSHSKS